MKTKMATSSLALSCLLAAPALADVTAADVWANQQVYYQSLGISLAGDLDGDTLSNTELNVIFPLGVASFQAKGGDITLTENNNGTVLITYPSPMTVTLAGGVANEGSFSATTTMTHDGYTIIASGEPGDITYETNVKGLRFDVGDVTLDAKDAGGFSMEGSLSLSSWVGTSRVTEGNLIAFSSTSDVGETVTDFTFGIDGGSSRSQQTTLPIQSVIAMTLPVGGSDVLNLSEAFRNGLSVVAQSTGQGSSSISETNFGNDMMNRQVTSTGLQTLSATLDENGMNIASDAVDFTMTMNDPNVLPMGIEVGIAQVTAAYDIPLNADEAPQDFRVATGLNGITLGDGIWNIIDFSRDLNREPADISFDITGSGTNGMDLLNVGAMMALSGPPPIEIDDLKIENLRIAALGAEVSAMGAVTFDWTDFQTIPGIARPEGKLTVNMNGVNGLLDTLGNIGLIPQDQMMMPRMMLGMFSTPVGDDMLETVLEMNAEGHILANGQRVQ